MPRPARARRAVFVSLVVGLVAAVAAVAAAPAIARSAPPAGEAGAIPDFTRGDAIPDGATHDWNLGPTGARGWMYSRKLETTEARQIRITSVDADSPADGVLVPGDVILGVGGARFAEDPRREFGVAIGAAEASDGQLALIRWRDDRESTVTVRLPVLGAYAATAPFDCPKSAAIFERGCAAIAARMEAEPDAGNPIERSYNALALLASGRPEYLPLIQRQVAWAAGYSDLERRSLHSWWYGPVNMLLAEYVLVTGDTRHMDDLRRVTMEIVRGQSAVGSWGHRFVQGNGRLAGYGMMNAPGLPLTISLVLAREAGIDDPELDAAIERAARLVRFYVGKGSIPYGDHHPWIEAHDDNGKNGAAAVLFNRLDDAEATAYFSRMSVASHGAERDTGHTGNYFNMLWAMPGVALSGPHASGAWMGEFGWAYDLARGWDGRFTHQGPPQARPDSYRNWDSTGAFMIAFAQADRRIGIAGRGGSAAPSLTPRIAASTVADGRGWGPRRGLWGYADRSEAALLAGLESWSPVVRERSAVELARRDGDPVPAIRARLVAGDRFTQLGAAQALGHLGPRAAGAVPALRRTLESDDLWLRVKAAEALAAIGDAAMPALPELLAMLARRDAEADPRGMEQRYLCFALFNRRGGLVGRSLEGVDRDALRAAVEAGLRNEDGRARGSLGSVYANLSYEEMRPLLPSVLEAILEPAPSGIMFADEIRIAGLKTLARYRIAEGVPLAIDLIDPDRWGMGNRIDQCLDVLRTYGGAARGEIPRIRALAAELERRNWNPDRRAKIDFDGLIWHIDSDRDGAALRPIDDVSTEG